MKLVFGFTLFCLLLIVFALTAGVALVSQGPISSTSPHSFYLLEKEYSPQRIILLLVGDIMLDRGVAWEIQKNGGDWTWPFHRIGEFLNRADLVFGNLESQISHKGTRVGSIYSFQANPAAIEGLLYAGFDVLSVANNHSFDYTREALEDSVVRLKRAGITPVGGGFSGKEAYDLVIKEINGTKIGFLAYTNAGSFAWAATETTGGIAWVDWNTLPEILTDITRAKELVDLLVVSLHAGIEYESMPTDAFQTTFAKKAIDAGADIFVGHHPHIVQPLEQYKEGWIAYSLGNFVFDQSFSQETMTGAILKVLVESKKIKEVALIPTRLTSSYQVILGE